jgi:flagellar protein FlaG
MAIPPVPTSPPPYASAAAPVTVPAPKQLVPTTDAAESPAPVQALSHEDVEKTVDEIRRHIAPVDQNLLFTIDKETGKTIVRLIDSSTKEILRQIPSEELVAIARALGKSSQSGLIERKA